MIRPLTTADVPAIKEVIDATGLFPSEMLGEMADGFLSGTETNERWLVLDDPSPVGIAYFAPEKLTDGTWNLYLIALHPDRQGRGDGSMMIGAVESQLSGMGARVLLVETSGLDAFEQTRRFYIKNGYHQEARIRDFYAAGEDKIVFWKALQ